MSWLRKIPIATLAVIVGSIIAIAWITMNGTAPLVISIAGGGLIAARATLGEDDA